MDDERRIRCHNSNYLHVIVRHVLQMSSCDDDVGFWVQNLDSTQSAEVFIEKNVEVASQSYVLRNTRANEQQNQQFPGSKLVKL